MEFAVQPAGGAVHPPAATPRGREPRPPVSHAPAAIRTPSAPLAASWALTVGVTNFAGGRTSAEAVPVTTRARAHASTAHGLKRIFCLPERCGEGALPRTPIASH